MAGRPRHVAEFGDFQTPPALAGAVCRLVARCGFRPASVVEPTSGTGNFLVAALGRFPGARTLIGLEVNRAHVAAARRAAAAAPTGHRARVVQGDFFTTDWPAMLDRLPEPVLVVGNPPWVTSADLGALGSRNLPEKANFLNHVGLDARTGKSNFDISEWMLLHLLDPLADRDAALAMLVKAAVARKVLAHAWRRGLRIRSARFHAIDASRWFGSHVEAGVLFCRTGGTRRTRTCRVHPDLGAARATGSFGWRDGTLVADPAAHARWKHLEGPERLTWRSGIKHDCRRVMELREEGGRLENGLGETPRLEAACLFPLLKGSDLARPAADRPARRLVVPQRRIGDDPASLRRIAPRTWRYLLGHAGRLDRRRSSIYRNRPRFAIFGVGDYTFAPWKVAVAGFYTTLDFQVVGPAGGRPVVFDDTVYFLPCGTRAQAEHLASLLNAAPARAFYRAFLFEDAKRPVTRELLGRLDLVRLARELGSEAVLRTLFGRPLEERP